MPVSAYESTEAQIERYTGDPAPKTMSEVCKLLEDYDAHLDDIYLRGELTSIWNLRATDLNPKRVRIQYWKVDTRRRRIVGTILGLVLDRVRSRSLIPTSHTHEIEEGR